jgi:hypothetical protein
VLSLQVLLLGMIGSSAASAGEWAFVGARYQGMGGAGVATVNDSFASYWNPAALGYAKSWDTAVDFGATASVEASILDTIDGLEELVGSSAFDSLVVDLNDGGGVSGASDATIAALQVELAKFAVPGDGVVGNVSSGFGLRWKNYTVFGRGLADFAVSPVHDSVRFASTDPDSDPNSILNNESGSRIRGLGVIEAGVGYGHSFFDGLVSVGANLKYLRGITFDKYVGYQSIEDADISFSDSDLRRESDAFGLDLGIMSKPFDWLRVGLVARNVNAPKFDVNGNTGGPNPVGSFRLEPQVRAGAAFYPFSKDFLIIATDIDLTNNKSDLIDGFRSRLWSFGAEVNLPLWVMSLALRGGGYMNTASGANQAFAFTAGVGLRVWLLSLEMSGGISPNSADVKGGDSFPSRANGSIVLALRGNF